MKVVRPCYVIAVLALAPAILGAQTKYAQFRVVVPTEQWLSLGDSKSIEGTYQPSLESQMSGLVDLDVTTETTAGSTTVASWAGAIDAELAAIVGVRTKVLFNLGVNDISLGLPSEATWKANLAYILDAIHNKWPSTQIYLMRPWYRGHAAECNTVAGWIGDVVATKAWTHLGPDERVFLENGDDGVTYTSDGVHPNASGYILTATQWKTVTGY